MGRDPAQEPRRAALIVADSVVGGVRFVALAAGGQHTCGLTARGRAWCWGGNRAGQLGIGAPDTLAHTAPAPVAGEMVFAALSAGFSHTCGVTPSGEAWCWGHNDYGRLGQGTTTNAGTPQPVAGGLLFHAVSAGLRHTCGVTTAGVALCWGLNATGALGTGTLENSLVPVRVAGP